MNEYKCIDSFRKNIFKYYEYGDIISEEKYNALSLEHKRNFEVVKQKNLYSSFGGQRSSTDNSTDTYVPPTYVSDYGSNYDSSDGSGL